MILHFPAYIEGRDRYFCLHLFRETHAFCIPNLPWSALSSNNSTSQVYDSKIKNKEKYFEVKKQMAGVIKMFALVFQYFLYLFC